MIYVLHKQQWQPANYYITYDISQLIEKTLLTQQNFSAGLHAMRQLHFLSAETKTAY